MSKKDDAKYDRRVALLLAYVITLAWAVSFTVDILVREYEPPASVHALMMIVAGATFGEGLLRTRTDNKEKNNGKSSSEDR